MSGKKLNLFSGTSYAIGSLIGSGILFLPSLTFEVSKSDVILSWIVATLLCIPLIIMFYDMSKIVDAGKGIKGYIEKGLGENISSCIPVLMLSTVIIGMPSSALIVGGFVREYFNIPGIQYFVAFYLLYFGIFTNLKGKDFGTKIQNIVSVLFIVVSISLFFLTFKDAQVGYSKIKPIYDIVNIFSGVTLAFWAFAGFESLSFVTADFENPQKDFLISMILALIICGLIYLGITINYTAIIPLNEVKSVMGIFQLSETVSPKRLSTLVITVLAILALKTNFNSWIRGLAEMIANASSDGILPSFLSNKDQDNKKPLMLLAILFTITLILQIIFPDFLKIGLIIVSSNFILIYVICIISYLRTNQSLFKKTIAIVTLAFLMISLATSKEKLLYPFVIVILFFVFTKLNTKRLRGRI